MSLREALVEALRLPPDSDTIRWLTDRGIGITDEGTMSQAIHDVFCGITADHREPSEKDHDQAKALLEAIQRHAG